MKIHLNDNNVGQNGTCVYSRNDVAALFPIAGKTVSQLCDENENLLIFPYSLNETNDCISESFIFNIQNTDDPNKVVITTGNIMGFIGTQGLQIKIKSRFDEGRDDYLLHYMLQKVLSFNLFNLNHNNEQEEIFNFAMFMFPSCLQKALRQGIYRDYQSYKRNDAKIKGTLDIGRHIKTNIPSNGNISYLTREYSTDNNMTQLIRHTIEFIKTQKYGLSILNINHETTENVKTILNHTPSYDKNNRRHIINKNLRQKIHPYYIGYHPLRSLCLQILQTEKFKYGDNNDEMSGILFDGAWLWEEYVNTILCKLGFFHPENRKKKGGIYLFEDRSGIRYPDFYKNDIVLDAKYKRLGSYDNLAKVDRNDIHQIISYITSLNANFGGFISPLEYEQTSIPTKKIKGLSATLSIFGIEISKCASSYESFCKEMMNFEDKFIASLPSPKV